MSSPAHGQAQDIDKGWPRDIETDSGTITIYQPQPEKLDGIALRARAAVSYTSKKKGTPVFGVTWFNARAQTDRDTRMVAIDDVTVADVRFPGITPDQEKKFKEKVEPELEEWDFTMSLDRLQSGLAAAAAEQRSADSLNTTPPVILFSKEPAALLSYSGDPVLLPVPNSQLKRVANTPMLVVLDSAAGSYYLSGGPLWYRAKSPLGPWENVKSVPAPVSALVPDSIQKDSAPPGGAPKIIVATKPTELIVTSGEPKWESVTGTDLLQVSNTDGNVFKLISNQKTYVLLSGRWFSASSFDGPWTFVRPDALPADFAKIPPASDAANVLPSVAGTSQAQDAVMDAYIPQTAAIDRSTAKVTVTYDGTPKFETITGTNLEYATNTSSQVLKIGGLYYACDQAVWFVSSTPNGPWAVSDSVPQSVQTIPPSSPVYNVKYVQVYETTPQVVYVGYTPGYVGMYPYYGTVVYGTGFYYPPYVGPYVYYPRPVTYGAAVVYNPWTGWTVGFGYATPFFYAGFMVGGPVYGGWWGPWARPPYPPYYYRPPYYGYPGYRPPYPGYRPPYPGYRPPGYPGYPGYRPPGGTYPPVQRPGVPGGGRPGTLPSNPGGVTTLPAHNNLYKRPGNVDRTRPSTQPAHPGVTDRVSHTRDNVVAGQNGSVYRNNGGNQWQSRDGGQWKGAQPSPTQRPGGSTQPTPRPSTPTTRPAQPSVPADVSRQFDARQRGGQRTQTYNNARAGAMPRGGGGGGGGRRR